MKSVKFSDSLVEVAYAEGFASGKKEAATKIIDYIFKEANEYDEEHNSESVALVFLANRIRSHFLSEKEAKR